MVGIPRPDFPDTALDSDGGSASDDSEAEEEAVSKRPRAYVQYDSVLESPASATRRRRLFAVAATLVALSAGWLIYRFLNG